MCASGFPHCFCSPTASNHEYSLKMKVFVYARQLTWVTVANGKGLELYAIAGVVDPWDCPPVVSILVPLELANDASNCPFCRHPSQGESIPSVRGIIWNSNMSPEYSFAARGLPPKICTNQSKLSKRDSLCSWLPSVFNRYLIDRGL